MWSAKISQKIARWTKYTKYRFATRTTRRKTDSMWICHCTRGILLVFCAVGTPFFFFFFVHVLGVLDDGKMWARKNERKISWKFRPIFAITRYLYCRQPYTSLRAVISSTYIFRCFLRAAVGYGFYYTNNSNSMSFKIKSKLINGIKICRYDEVREP